MDWSWKNSQIVEFFSTSLASFFKSPIVLRLVDETNARTYILRVSLEKVKIILKLHSLNMYVCKQHIQIQNEAANALFFENFSS